jgi:hypothetical protein
MPAMLRSCSVLGFFRSSGQVDRCVVELQQRLLAESLDQIQRISGTVG